MKLSDAKRRTLQYMADHDIGVALYGRSTGWTMDTYQWPVNTQTIESMCHLGLLEQSPESNEYTVLRLTEAGRVAVARQPDAKREGGGE